jgi:hypothetical protein
LSVESWTRAGGAPASTTATACASYAPGHQMHYIHQGQALRSPSLRVRALTVDGDRLLISLDNGEELVWRHHDPARLTDVLGLFPTFRVIYPQFHALRAGPYWFNCAENAFVPCEPAEAGGT